MASALYDAEDLKIYLAEDLLPLDKLVIMLWLNFAHSKRDTELVLYQFARITGVSMEVLRSEIAGVIAENEILNSNFQRDEKGILS